MAESTEKTGDKKLSISTTKTLTLKPRGSETGVVRQSFSHGRTKSVVVEKVRSRTPGKPATAKAEPAAPAPTPSAPAGKRPARPRLPLRPRRRRRRRRPAWCCTR
jgi:translation initiation factor IF-2